MTRADARRIEFIDDPDEAPEETRGEPSDLGEPFADDTGNGERPGIVPASPSPTRRRRRALVAAATVAVLAVVAGAGMWQQHRESAHLRDQTGAVSTLASALVAKASVDVDAAPIVWLGEDLMASRGGALVGLDPADGHERWRLKNVKNMVCDTYHDTAFAAMPRLQQVNCVESDGSRLITVAAGGTLSRDLTLPSADAWTLTDRQLVQANWEGESVHVTGLDFDGTRQWSTQVQRGDPTPQACTSWAQEPGATEPAPVHDDHALSLGSQGDTVFVTGCGVYAQLTANGDITHAPLPQVERYSLGATTIRVTDSENLSEAHTQILDPNGSAALTVQGVVAVPSCGDGQVSGWYVRRLAGLARLDEQGHQLWVARHSTSSVVAALADTTIATDYSGIWGLDTATGDQLWEHTLTDLTGSWDPAQPSSYALMSAFTDGQTVALALAGFPDAGTSTTTTRMGLVALDAATGKVRWQVLPEDTWWYSAEGHLIGTRSGEANSQLIFYG